MLGSWPLWYAFIRMSLTVLTNFLLLHWIGDDMVRTEYWNPHFGAKSLNSDSNCHPSSEMITSSMLFSLNILFISLITVHVLRLWSLQMIETLLKYVGCSLSYCVQISLCLI